MITQWGDAAGSQHLAVAAAAPPPTTAAVVLRTGRHSGRHPPAAAATSLLRGERAARRCSRYQKLHSSAAVAAPPATASAVRGRGRRSGRHTPAAAATPLPCWGRAVDRCSLDLVDRPAAQRREVSRFQYAVRFL